MVLVFSSVLAGTLAASPDRCMSGNIVDRLCKAAIYRDPAQIVAAPGSADLETIQPLEEPHSGTSMAVSGGENTVSDVEGDAPGADNAPLQSEINTSGTQTASEEQPSSPSMAATVPPSGSPSINTNTATTSKHTELGEAQSSKANTNATVTTTTDTPPGYIEHSANTGNLLTADDEVYGDTGTPPATAAPAPQKEP